ncbi:MAG: uroporphyrinogen-III synthase [Chloroflexota bacterium]|nr:uroporphyrinogen-III synthase [Chloroflexota bacterium]
MASLNGRTIAFVEARMTSEMAGLIERHGGVPYPAPVLQEVYLKDSPEVQQLVLDTCAGRIDAVTLLTGVGTQALVSAAAAMGRETEFIQSLDQLTVIARSPKPARVLRQHKIHIDVMPPEPYTTADLVNSLESWDLADKVVALQHYGGPNRPLVTHLQEKGAQVREVTLYTWGLPEDETPVLQMVDGLAAGSIDAIAFTSQPQVGNLLTIAAKAEKETALRAALGANTRSASGDRAGGAVVASVGPVCTRRLKEAGIPVDVEPEHPHMGSMVLALAEYFG